jgi:hypothetical protein
MMLPQKDPQARVELQYLRSEGEKREAELGERHQPTLPLPLILVRQLARGGFQSHWQVSSTTHPGAWEKTLAASRIVRKSLSGR